MVQGGENLGSDGAPTPQTQCWWSETIPLTRNLFKGSSQWLLEKELVYVPLNQLTVGHRKSPQGIIETITIEGSRLYVDLTHGNLRQWRDDPIERGQVAGSGPVHHMVGLEVPWKIYLYEMETGSVKSALLAHQLAKQSIPY